MKKFIIVLLFIFAISICAFSQINESVAGARAGGMADASVTLQDTWSVFNNPAGLTGMESSNIGVFYENRFGLKETGYGAMAFATPLGAGSLGLGITHFGYSLFQTSNLGLAYAQQLFGSFSMGVKINYLSILQSDYYDNLNAFTFDIGILSKPTDEFSIAFHVFNPLNLSYTTDINEKLPVIYKLGFSYLFSSNLLIAIETGKATNGEIPIFKAGLEYIINEEFVLRTGFSTHPVEYSFGAGYIMSHFRFDIAYAYHQILGSIPKVSLNYAF